MYLYIGTHNQHIENVKKKIKYISKLNLYIMFALTSVRPVLCVCWPECAMRCALLAAVYVAEWYCGWMERLAAVTAWGP